MVDKSFVDDVAYTSPLKADQARKIMLKVAAHARDADDLRLLLDVLGLPEPSPGKRATDRI